MLLLLFSREAMISCLSDRACQTVLYHPRVQQSKEWKLRKTCLHTGILFDATCVFGKMCIEKDFLISFKFEISV